MTESPKLFKNEIFKAYSIFFIGILLRYFLPLAIGDIYFWLIILFFIKSKRDYFYIALLLLFISAPGYIFFKDGIYHLPEINISAFGRSIYYSEIFAFVAIIKGISKKQKVKIKLYKPIYLILLYIVFLFFITFLYGVGIMKLLRTIRFVYPFFLLLTVPSLISSEEEILKFSKLIFSFVFLMIFMQLFDIVVGVPFALLLGEKKFVFSGEQLQLGRQIFDVAKGPVRTIYGVQILFLSFILSLFYLVKNQNYFSKRYLYIILAIPFLAVIMGAYRTWTIAFSFALILYVIYYPAKVKIIMVGIIVVLSLFFSSSKLQMQINEAVQRLMTINLLFQGDKSVGGTYIRLTVRGPRVMHKFKESPLVGFGFSQQFFEYADGHVGNQTLLLNGGILGYLIYAYFWIYFILKLNKISKKNKSKYLVIFIIGLITLLIINTNSMKFSYLLQVPTALLLAVFFTIANYYFIDAKRQLSKGNKNI